MGDILYSLRKDKQLEILGNQNDFEAAKKKLKKRSIPRRRPKNCRQFVPKLSTILESIEYSDSEDIQYENPPKKVPKLLELEMHETYVHTNLSYQVPHYQSMQFAASNIQENNTQENLEIQNTSDLIIWILTTGAVVKAFKKMWENFSAHQAKKKMLKNNPSY